MDKRSDDIRQDIEQTRASLDEKIDQLQSKANEAVDQAKQTVDIGHQIGERPYVALGIALAVGFVVGKLGGRSTATHSEYLLDQPGYKAHQAADRNSSGLLKTLAVAVVTSLANQAARQAVPILRQQIAQLGQQRSAGTPLSQREPTSAPNADLHSVPETINYDAIPQTNRYGMPPPTPSHDEEAYYRTYEPETNERRVGERA